MATFHRNGWQVCAGICKNHAISLRLSEFDLELLKKKAESEGLPYQTLINSVLHKYVTDQLYDKNEMRKALSQMTAISAP